MLNIAEEGGLARSQTIKTLESSGFERFAHAFERTAAREPGRTPMVIELAHDFSNWHLDGFWRNLKLDAREWKERETRWLLRSFHP